MLADGWKIMAVAVALGGVVATSAHADVKAGIDAWQAGNFDGAIKEWRPLAIQGDMDAQFNMGQAYKLGRGVPQDPASAESWFRKAAVQGHFRAQANLGLLLYESNRRAEAMPWITKAAAQGDARAQYVMGIELTNAEILERDWPRAYAMMSRAASQGLAPAVDSLEKMNGFISATDREKGIAMAQQMGSADPSTVLVAPPPATGKPASPQPAPARPVPVQPVPATSAPLKPAPPKAPQVAASPPPARPAPVSAPVAVDGRWRVQFGAFSAAAAAKAHWGAVTRKVSVLSSLQPSYEPAGTLVRLRAGPFASRTAADKACTSARDAGLACFTIAP